MVYTSLFRTFHTSVSTRLRIAMAALVGAATVLTLCVSTSAAVAPTHRAVGSRSLVRAGAAATVTPTSRFYGVLQPVATTYVRLKAAGVTRGSLEIGWNDMESVRGQLNSGYLAQVRARYTQMRAAGLDVVLDTGLQYPPSWVFGLDGSTRFVNQYGDVWHAGMGADVPDAVFDAKVRTAQASYLNRLGSALSGLSFAAVRVGGLYYSELHFPPSVYGTHHNAFWAFSAAANAASPDRAYRPGVGTAASASAFLSWYLKSINDYGVWLAGVYRASFGAGPTLQILLPSWGVRPGEVAAAAAGRLTGRTSGELRGTLNEGLNWSDLIPRLRAVAGTQPYTTWLDAPDQGTSTGLMSPARYIHSLAAPVGLTVAGENTGWNSASDMTRCVQRVASLGLQGMMWMRGPDLTDARYASLADLRALIGG